MRHRSSKIGALIQETLVQRWSRTALVPLVRIDSGHPNSTLGTVSQDTSTNLLPYYFADYLELVDWTGRAIREDKRGSIATDLPPILQRLGLNPNQWRQAAEGIEKNFYYAIGHVASLQQLSQRLNKRWLHGTGACRALYQAQAACPPPTFLPYILPRGSSGLEHFQKVGGQHFRCPTFSPISPDERAFFSELGARIAELRKAQGITQIQMAEALGVSQQTINFYKVPRRRIPVSALPVLAELSGFVLMSYWEPAQKHRRQAGAGLSATSDRAAAPVAQGQAEVCDRDD